MLTYSGGPVLGAIPAITRPGGARAWTRSDAEQLSLNGDWRFRYSPAEQRSTDFAAPHYDDSAWDRSARPVVVATARVTAGPIYTNVRYPFPVDPPRVPGQPHGRLPHQLRHPCVLGRRPGGAPLRRGGFVRAGLAQRARSRRHVRQPAGRGVRCLRARGPLRTRTCSPSASTNGRRAAISRIRTCGGCPGSSAMSPCCGVRPTVSTTSSCMPATTRTVDEASCASTRRGGLGAGRGTRRGLRAGKPFRSTTSSPGRRSCRALYGVHQHADETVTTRIGFRTVEIADGC